MIQRSKAEALGGDLLQAAWLTLLDKKAELPLRCVSGRFARRQRRRVAPSVDDRFGGR